MRKDPKPSTLKKLFALSGNQCAFSKCTKQLIANGNVVCNICHIEAAEPGGERYNKDQTDEERRSFENLILFCYEHHVETNDVIKYPVDTLQKIKKDHEKSFEDKQFAITDEEIQKAVEACNYSQQNSNNGSGTQNNYQYNTYLGQEKKDFGIISEIIEFVLKQEVDCFDYDLIKKDNGFSQLAEKIILNFSKDDLEAIDATLKNAWGHKQLVEKFVTIEREERPDRINALIDKIQTEYRSIKNCKSNSEAVDDFKIIELIAQSNLPVEKQTNPEYLLNSKAIVLYCFELCFFGKKVKQEIQIQKMLF